MNELKQNMKTDLDTNVEEINTKFEENNNKI